jgi:aspartyl-tRNA(Asn)/glutamyl-tRNA(Gln) amidotransferase subunit C
VSVSREEVERIAGLAALALDPAELPELTAQMDRIVGFVARLAEAGSLEELGEAPDTPVDGPLREDVVLPADLARSPAELAPEFVDGFFVVPRLGAMEES